MDPIFNFDLTLTRCLMQYEVDYLQLAHHCTTVTQCVKRKICVEGVYSEELFRAYN